MTAPTPETLDWLRQYEAPSEIEPIPQEGLAWLQQSARVHGATYSQVLLHVLERIELLDKDAIEQSQSNRFCFEAVIKRLEKLEAAQQHDTLLIGGPQDKLDRLIELDSDDDAPTPEAAPVATENGLLRCYGQAIGDAVKRGASAYEAKEAGRRACYDLGLKHGAARARCPHIRSSDEGSAWCALAEQTATPQPASPVAPVGALAARALLERVAAMADRIGAHTVGDIATISERAAAWLRDNPPGQPVAIEPRGCPAPGACSCMEPAPPVAPAGGLVERVALAIGGEGDHPVNWTPEARAAIRQVAAWLDQQGQHGCSLLLREEADR